MQTTILKNGTEVPLQYKRCCRCKKDVSLDLFHYVRGKVGYWCKECDREYSRTRYEQNKIRGRDKRRTFVAQRKQRKQQWMCEYLLTHPCIDCDEEDIRTLEFHHSDPSNKERAVSEWVSSTWALERVIAEIEKCVVLCANCHAIREQEARFNYRSQFLKTGKVKNYLDLPDQSELNAIIDWTEVSSCKCGTCKGIARSVERSHPHRAVIMTDGKIAELET